MPILQIEHPVADFDAWKAAFDRDPIDRARGGVQRYRVMRPVDDPRYVVVDLEFANVEAAATFREALEVLWKRVEGTVMHHPRARILDVVETVQLRG
jgi:hypothetical protein